MEVKGVDGIQRDTWNPLWRLHIGILESQLHGLLQTEALLEVATTELPDSIETLVFLTLVGDRSHILSQSQQVSRGISGGRNGVKVYTNRLLLVTFQYPQSNPIANSKYLTTARETTEISAAGRC